jgi:hypothetical protein
MFKDVDYNIKVHIKEQLWPLVLPETTFMHPPPRKVDTKDAPKKDKHIVHTKKGSPSL